MKRIYFDHAATTPLHPDVLQAMTASMHNVFGNASSVHAYGREAKSAVNQSRDRIAARLGCRPQELVFTSGGTESDNAALFGAAWAAWLQSGQSPQQDKHRMKPHIVTTQVEHHAVLHACERLEALGFDVTYVAPDETGFISADKIESALRPNTCLVSVMYGNNEVGTLQPIREIGEIAREHGILMHTDAVQALGMIPLQLNELPVDFASFSAHKVNGPKGVGALYIRTGALWDPFLYGGNQERKRRAGTENIAGIAGFAEAVERAAGSLDEKIQEASGIRDALWTGLKDSLGDRVVRNGHPSRQLPHILNVSILDVPTETMLMNLDLAGIMAASGSACTSGSLEVSHVLEAMELSEERKRTAVRFSCGLGNTREEAAFTVQQIATIVSRVRTRQ
ncbi:cysteine desulfurase family protein [Paenibacillus apiarius]|uniref:cysteine desulfurase n=1 Tax=Paenibacillus apiarius TaxID=46240 RepID=A0ABT4DXG9_9BACL|nr:cysteine desulfurase family protein [Paenibacillus apiarius]MCY9512913.1 cysteine desulfurase [Paenibacillus apiarius]MCY9522038.1 cysteine desulfurase [Paenibacillus apiarius]MCY9554143.1 cysteine desulfurase [Paenibacillus apiarius]MCY9558798.1 cysteine desulfurase [Paenibacillus apiarius]MCY9683845.1 cysteine desulfurase [Paenibacillus apiarius]